MSREFSFNEQVFINAIDAEHHFRCACEFATKMMADIQEDYLGYNEMWMLFFYQSYKDADNTPDEALDTTIALYQTTLKDMNDRAGGVPWELEWHPDGEEELKKQRQRGRMLLKAFEWLSPTSRGKKSPETE